MIGLAKMFIRHRHLPLDCTPVSRAEVDRWPHCVRDSRAWYALIDAWPPTRPAPQHSEAQKP